MPFRSLSNWLRALRACLRAGATGCAALCLLGVLLVGLLLLPVPGLGRPVVTIALVTTRRLAGRARRTAEEVLGWPVESRYTSVPGSAPGQVDAALRDRQTRRDGCWLLAHGLLGTSLVLLVAGLLALTVAGVGYWRFAALAPLTLVAVAVWGARPAERWFAELAAALLGADPGLLAQRVADLTESRAASVDASAAELRRIERDLHDGAQARLASFGINLGLARQLLRSDPDEAERLIAAGQADARRAQAELRDLVRGIHPPVLADRGLPGALEAAALQCPVPVEVTVDLPERPEPPVESAVYFAVAEALTNVGRHSGATRAWLRAGWQHGLLRVVVGDDGSGGAEASRGTGLHGIARRLAAFDGTVSVHSPTGGPTEIRLEVPCASSSPRTTSSSATA